MAVSFVAVVSCVCLLSAMTLLKNHNENINFTQKELNGLTNYDDVVRSYLDAVSGDTGSAITNGSAKICDGSLKNEYQEFRNYKSLPQEQLIASFTNLIHTIGDACKLILDPGLDSYYLNNILLNDIPDLISHIGDDENAKLIPYLFNDIDRSIRVAKSVECMNCESLDEDFKALHSVLLSPSSTESKLSAKEKINLFVSRTEEILRHILEKRLHQQIYVRNLMIAIIVWIYAAVVLFCIYLFRNYYTKQEMARLQERQRLVAELAEKSVELEKFAYMAAHDLKEPMRTMCSYATLLKSEFTGSDQAAVHYLQHIEDAARRATQTINDLLGGEDRAAHAYTVEACDCRAELRHVMQDLKESIDAERPTIHIGDLPTIRMVPSMFRRVMGNLLSNSLKYRCRDVPLIITVQAEQQGPFWIFSVSDNGIGIIAKDSSVLFDPFKRLTHSMHRQGTGIGLISCKEAVEQHGGNIWIAPGVREGTTIFFSIPA